MMILTAMDNSVTLDSGMYTLYTGMDSSINNADYL